MDRPTILVVEDEPAIADTIQYALESEGFRCLRLEVGAGVVEVLDRAAGGAGGARHRPAGHERHRGLPAHPRSGTTCRSSSSPRAAARSTASSGWSSGRTTTSPNRSARASSRPAPRRCCGGSGAARRSRRLRAGAAFALDEERRQISYFGTAARAVALRVPAARRPPQEARPRLQPRAAPRAGLGRARGQPRPHGRRPRQEPAGEAARRSVPTSIRSPPIAAWATR